MIEQGNMPAEMLLTHVDLFKGAGAKFQPFLGPMSGAFELSYKGTKPNVWLDIDIWKQGKKVSSGGSIGDLFFHPDLQKNHKVEIIISIEAVFIDGQYEFNTIKVRAGNDSGSSLSTFTVPWDKSLTSRGLIFPSDPLTFKADDSIPVSTSTNMISTADLSPDSLKGLESAIIFTLRFED
ncbi:hypothetical protein FHS16_001436 [Paenibacillus endophyticus]|uniref:Uncharacterized protein n=1 Tax=Paenibacillus endophyticus TaxID=1294268 RepID=A0A7W5C5G3_9BACL|nr:hypothetical protein [Paenibacillus endophyticus]MBB3151393.1 hypothetical protein [Paenibacillus endophyticus]